MKKITPRFALMTVWVLVVSGFMLWLMKNPLLDLTVSDLPALNYYVNYELVMFAVAWLTVVVIRLLAPKVKLSFLNLRNIDGPVEPTPLLGIKEKGKERWRVLGLTVGTIITLVTATVMYFMVRGNPFTGSWAVAFWVIVFAAMNSFIEEVIYRLSFATVGEDSGMARGITLGFGALVFGAVHYFGIAPSGVLGVILASYIGFFLTKSILETRGFFWARMIHLAQDIVIIGALAFWGGTL